MGTLSLTDPENGTTADASLIADNNAAIKTVVNGGIDNTNVNASAALSISKLAGFPNDGTKVLFGDGTWGSSGGTATGTEIAYDAVTSSVSVTVTTEGSSSTVISGSNHTYDGAAVMVEFFSPSVNLPSGGQQVTISLFESSTQVARIAFARGAAVPSGAGDNGGGWSLPGVTGKYRFTPSAATHTYSVKAFVNTGTATIVAGAGGATDTYSQAYLRITKV